MTFRGYATDIIRGTLITLYFISYDGAPILRRFLSGIALSVFLQNLLLGPANIGGLYMDNKLTQILSENFAF